MDGSPLLSLGMGHRSISLILAGTLLWAAGCKDTGSTAPAADEAVTAQDQTPIASEPSAPRKLDANDLRPIVACFGDSLTAGHGADPGASYPDFLQKDLDRDGFHVHVVNEGVSGNTTKDGLDRLHDLLALKPKIVVLEFGGNDGLRGLNVATTRDNLASMIKALQAANIQVVIAGITLPPDYGTDYVSRFTANYASLGRQFHVPVLPFLLKDVYGVPGMMQADRTHATDRGNAVVAQNVLPYVEKLLRKH